MQNQYDLQMEKWNDRLRQARDKAGVKNTEIARALKISDPTVSAWMSGNIANIEGHNLLAVCKMLGVSPFWIMSGDESPAEITSLPESAKLPAIDTIRLLALYAQASDDGRRRIMELALLVGGSQLI